MRVSNIFRTLTIATLLVAMVGLGGCKRDTSLRILYWNFQNGMWADEPNNYDNFVEWVKKYDPDVCIWCEAQTIYEPGSNKHCADDARYLIDNWGELAARFGHNYWEKSGHRDNYPQVITSKLPIEVVEQIVGSKPDSVVTHGAGHYRVEFCDKKLNIVTLHTWPQRHAYHAEDIEASRAANGGDYYRLKEMTYICEHTINSSPNAEQEFWFMAGDFNSRNRNDNHYYKFSENSTAFLVHDYIAENTPYIDIIGERYAGEFQSTVWNGSSRIDYAYCTEPLYERIIEASVIRDEYTGNTTRDKKTGFIFPSDHLPILVDLEMK